MLLLNIDTSINSGSFCVSNNEKIIAFEHIRNSNAQAGWLHAAIQSSFAKNRLSLQQIDAVAVSNGPGSYTGVRIGLSTAKGLCYALNKPLICVSTLQIMAAAVINQAHCYICPMIDARRMEVFTSIFDKNLAVIKEPFATVLDENSFSDILEKKHIVFTGNGTQKFESLIGDKHPNATFVNQEIDARSMVHIAINSHQKENFSSVAYSQPYYIKEAYISKK